MKKIYISGKITGDPNYQEKFLAEENRLRALGYEPVNPAAIIINLNKYVNWNDAMRLVLCEMLDCDGVSLLPDWKNSKGAKIEVRLAIDLGIDSEESFELGLKPDLPI